jgi:hypothetical protein
MATALAVRPGPAAAARPVFVVRAASLAIVALPLLRPAALGNVTPADGFLALLVAATLTWVGVTSTPIGVPYLVPVALGIVAGGAAAVHAGLTAQLSTSLPLVQDGWLLMCAAALFNVLRDARTVRTVLRAWAASGFAWAVILLAGSITGQTAITGVNERTGGRVALTLGDSNYAANYFLVSLLISIACGYPRTRRWRFIAGAFMLLAIVMTGSNGGVLCAALSLAGLGVIGVRRRFGTMFAIAFAASMLLVAVVQVGECTDRPIFGQSDGVCLVHVGSLVEHAKTSDVKVIADGVGRAGQSTSQRGELLQESSTVFRSSSLWGIGATQIKVELARRQVPFVKEAHNDYAAALIERGALGALSLVVLIGAVFLRLLPIVGDGLRASMASVLPRPEALVWAVAVMGLAGWFYEVLHLRHLWALLAIVAAISHWGAADRAEDGGVPRGLVPISRTTVKEPALP